MADFEITLFWGLAPCCPVNTFQLIAFEEYLSAVDTMLAIGSDCEDGGGWN
jgi:hypothetical protein